MLVEYTAYDRTGKRVSGTLEAGSEKIAEDILWEADLIVARVRKVRKLPSLYTMLPSVFGVKQRDAVGLIRQLSTLLDSGLPLLIALQAISHEKVHPMIKDAISDISQSISEGGQFSDGIARFPNIFPPILVRVARIGEQTGELSDVLRRGADYLESQSEVKSKLRSSLSYPAIVFGTAVLSIYILLNFSIPMMAGLLEEFGGDLPLITRILIAVSDFLRAFGLWILILMVLAIVLGVLYRRRPDGKLVTDRILLRLPVLGGMVQKSTVSRMTQTLASLLSSGIPLLEAVELTRDNTENAVMKQGLERARVELLAGGSLSDVFSLDPIFPPMVTEVVRVGETTGNMAVQLRVIGDALQKDFDASLSRMVQLIEPAMILMVGAVVGVIGITVISTVYSILPNIGN